MGKNNEIKIGIDLDNTITASKQSIKFFSVLTNLLSPESEIHIITNRTPGTEGEVCVELQALGIHYDHLKITANKAKYIRENSINFLFEDTEEYFLEIGEETTVFKIREAGNFSFSEKKWITSRQNSILIDD